jgi:Flp pilus assembly protein TadD/septal ring factor EnvC (AmiA/AmiB activator)
MRKIGLVLFAGLLAASVQLRAQADDPSEIFLKAYMTAQQGEKLEHENQLKAALAKYRFAGSLIEELRKNHAGWQPAIVDYRGRKISESILRLQDKVATQNDLAATAPPPETPTTPEEVTQSSATPEPAIETAPQKPINTARIVEAPPPSDAAIKAATEKLNAKLDQLRAELEKSRDQLGAAQKEKDTLNSQLKGTSSKLEKAQVELEKTKTAEGQVRDQLVKAQESLKTVQDSGDANTKSQQALRAEITRLKDALIAAESARAAAEKEKDATNAKMGEANNRIAAVSKERDVAAQARDAATKERDTALAQVKRTKEVQQRVEVLMAENVDLKKKLAEAEKTARDLSEDKPKKEQQLAEVRRQIDELQKQLAASQKQNRNYETQVADLRSQLDIAAAQLEKAKLVGATAEETARLRKENDMLRNIVMRERQEEARRDQAKKLMLAEFEKLKINSDTLNQQINLLAQPVTKLSDEELALLRQPIVSLSDNNPATIKASFAFAKKTTATSVSIAGHRESDSEDENAPPGNSGATVDSSFKPDVPDELRPVAHTAKENFERGKYRSAEKQYQEILVKAPNNLYSLSNLGVVYFRTGRFKAAELTLKKAVALSPRDEFAHTTLGIVYYRQAKFDAALTELTKSLAINPKSATAHNYLGITASQKGWQEAAEKELLEALNSNPNYADAHFNLAVIYATAQPPARELARQHYVKATALGAQPDISLEKLLH